MADPQWLTVREAAEMLGENPGLVRRRIVSEWASAGSAKKAIQFFPYMPPFWLIRRSTVEAQLRRNCERIMAEMQADQEKRRAEEEATALRIQAENAALRKLFPQAFELIREAIINLQAKDAAKAVLAMGHLQAVKEAVNFQNWRT